MVDGKRRYYSSLQGEFLRPTGKNSMTFDDNLQENHNFIFGYKAVSTIQAHRISWFGYFFHFSEGMGCLVTMPVFGSDRGPRRWSLRTQAIDDLLYNTL